MKAHEFDKKIKGQVKKIEQTAPVTKTWDINKSWDKLSQLLKQASPKSIVWYFSLAASVSMVMANVSLLEYGWEGIKESETEIANSNNKIVRTTYLVNSTASNNVSLTQLKSIPARGVNSIPSMIATVSTADFTPERQAVVLQEVIEPKSKLIPILNSSIASSGAAFSGEIMFISNKRIKNTSLGISLEMSSQVINSFIKEGTSSNHSRQALYMNMIVVNEKAKRPWSARIGTPLWQTNRADSTAPMIKMNYQTKVGSRVHIGPEIIFTKGFKKVYPGISLSFG